jgi:alcohol dehydrogenase (cytochrome c)
MKRLTIILVVLVALPAPAQVTFERLKKATSEPHNWLTYSGDYTGQRYSHLNQITRDNVSQLGMEWAFQTGATGNFQATPLVMNHVRHRPG